MKKSMYYENCIKEIRSAVFGRDNRKPIADAIVAVKEMDYHVKKVTTVDTEEISDDYYCLVFHDNKENE